MLDEAAFEALLAAPGAVPAALMPRVDLALARDWVEWHAAYDDPGNPHARRLAIVQRRVAEALDAAPTGRIDVISMCAGEGRDLLGVLERHPRAADVRARLVELDPATSRWRALARRRSPAPSVEVVEGDAGATDAYAGAVPAHLALVCGVWGNVPDADVARTIAALPALLADACDRDLDAPPAAARPDARRSAAGSPRPASRSSPSTRPRTPSSASARPA